MDRKIRREQIYLANLEPIIGSEQGGIRPVLIIQNNKGNRHSGTTIAAPITTKRIRITTACPIMMKFTKPAPTL